MTSTIKVTYKGKTKTLGEWAIEYGRDYKLLYNRYVMKWPINERFFSPPEEHKQLCTVLNVAMPGFSPRKQKQMEAWILLSIAKERKKSNKAKYREVKAEIEIMHRQTEYEHSIEGRLSRLEEFAAKVKTMLGHNLKIA